jgi:predicted TIM-barrel fold metal-dependent hydrolase
MNIDIHTHIGFSQIYPFRYMAGMMGPLTKVDENKMKVILDVLLADKSCENMLRQMDAADTEKAVLLIIDGGIGLGEAQMSLAEIYELHYKVLRSHNDRFIVFGGVDPRRGAVGLELFKRGVFEYGFRGLKLYPPMGYSVDDENLAPYYEICSQHGLPVLIHTGPSLSILDNERAEPIRYVTTLQKYPRINFILAHMGYELDNEIVQKLLRLDNVYLDISGFQLQSAETLMKIFQKDYNERILYGSDWPLFNTLKPLKSHIEVLKNIYNEMSHVGTENGFENLMFKNALKVLS